MKGRTASAIAAFNGGSATASILWVELLSAAFEYGLQLSRSSSFEMNAILKLRKEIINQSTDEVVVGASWC
jgi:hypothetical protein